MNEKKKMIFILAILCIFVIAIGAVIFKSYKDEKRVMDSFYNTFNQDKRTLIFIGRDGCYYCQLLKPILEDFDSQYQFGYLYVNTDKISTSKLNEILNVLELDTETFGTPTSVIVENGQVIANSKGSTSEKTYFEFLKENGIINTDEPNLINYINYEEYTNLLNNNQSGTLIVIGDSHDDQYKTMMKYLRNIKAENNIAINYFSMLEISQENSSEFTNVSLPTMIVINSSRQKVTLEGNKTYEEYVTFLQNNGIIK